MRQILTKAQFAAFVPKVIEIVKTAQGKGQKGVNVYGSNLIFDRSKVARKTLISPFCDQDLRPAVNHLEETLNYNLVGGKMTR